MGAFRCSKRISKWGIRSKNLEYFGKTSFFAKINSVSKKLTASLLKLGNIGLNTASTEVLEKQYLSLDLCLLPAFFSDVTLLAVFVIEPETVAANRISTARIAVKVDDILLNFFKMTTNIQFYQ